MKFTSEEEAIKTISPRDPRECGVAIHSRPITLVTVGRLNGRKSESSYGTPHFNDEINSLADYLECSAEKALDRLLKGSTAYSPSFIRFIKELQPLQTPPTPSFYRVKLEKEVGQSFSQIDGNGIFSCNFIPGPGELPRRRR